MRSELFNQAQENDLPGMSLQNPRMLRVVCDGEFYARKGAMVAYQGDIDFAHQGSGLGRFTKKMLTGEGLPLMRVFGKGTVFLARDAWEIHILDLEDESITVNGNNVLAF